MSTHDEPITDTNSSSLLRVAFQGQRGAYSEAAIYEYLCNSSNIHYPKVDRDRIQAVGYEAFEDVFEAVASSKTGHADLGMIPIENTLGGTIHANYDLLLRYSGSVYIRGELDYPVKHCLLTKDKVLSPDDIEVAYSHPQALAQCAHYLRKHNIKPMLHSDTAGAAKMLSTTTTTTTTPRQAAAAGAGAAISSRLAADIYNLHVADTDIQDVSFNHTRFLLLGRAPSPYVALHNTPIPTKVSLVFRVHDTPGSLHRSLSAFSHRGLQLCKLESRPVPPDMLDETTNLETSLVDNTSDDGEAYSNPQQHGNMAGGYYHYLCYIDVLKMPGQDKAVDRAIETLKEFNPFVRVLSVYPSSSSYHHTISPSTRSPTNLPETSHTTPPPHQGKRRSVSFIGYGKFAQFLCERLTRLCGTGGGGGSVNFSATNRKEDDTGCAHHAATLGIRYYPDMKDMLDNEKPDIIVIATSVLSFAEVVNKLSAIMKSERGRGKRKDILLVDVCSVKEYPQQIMREAFQDYPNVSILCTHPMFGPDSGKYGWYNLPLVYDDDDGNGSTSSPTSHGDDDDDDDSRSWWLSLFERCGCRLVSMSTAEHDKISAATQFITHLTGRVLGGITPRLHTTNIDTLGFRSLIKLMHNTINDSDALFKGLYRYNKASGRQLIAFNNSLQSVKDMLQERTTPGDTTSLSDLCNRVPSSTTVRLHGQALELKRQGKDIQGALGVGEPDFSPPTQVISAIVSSLTSGFGCKYSPSNGIFELREAVADDLGTRKNIQCINGSNVIITASGKAAIAAALMTILNTGDEMIIPTPCWPTFPDLALMCNATPVFIHTSSPDYAITAHSIASVITPKTRVLLLNSPCNPTGHVIPKDELIRIGALLEEHTHIMVVCDDLYERLVYDGDVHYTLAGICNPTVRSRIITIGGFSKAFAMTGLRLGYAVCSDDKWIKGMGKILGQITGCACTASQAGGLAALRDVPSSWHQKKLAQLQHKRDLLFARLQAIPNVVCPREPPKGAFYAMPDLGYYVNKMRELKGDDTLAVSQLCEQLLSSQGLSIVPGEGFYTTQPVVRLSYATSVEDINDACDRLRDFLLSLETC